MKKHLLMLSAALSLTVGATAQNVSTIDWDREISVDAVKAATTTLADFLGTSLSAQYALRGGKDNGTPESHCYQYEYCLNLDNYAGYMVVSHYDFPYANANLQSTYAMHESFNGGARGQYTMVKNILIPLLRQSALNDLPEVKAINLLFYCLAAQECADISGPYSYLEDKQNSENPTTYNDLKTIYTGIVADLDNIVPCLKNYENRSSEYQECINAIINTYQTTNGLSGKNYIEACWRLANSLKLRMAMRIVKVEPALAQQWAEDAVASGVVESVKMQSGMFPLMVGFTNPLKQIINQWCDNRMNASFETILTQLDHPYAKYLFKKNTMSIVNSKTKEQLPKNTKVVGIRAGAHVGEGQTESANQYISASTFESDYGFVANAPLYLLKWAEVDFLRAEGALRGWNMGGTAQKFYERGIKNACLDDPSATKYYEDDYADGFLPDGYYDMYVDEYMELEAAKPYTQVDPFGDGEDWVSPITIGVKWNDADNDETKLEKIITQKWLALWPLSSEAWAEVRRTGYPRLIPVMNPEDGDGSLKYGDMIRRMPWAPTTEIDKALVNGTGIQALGGPDLQATRLWWDVEAPNFPDAISSVAADADNTKSGIYNLAGQKVSAPKAGLYIVNGKKTIVK